ncbi:MAG: peptide deformylase [Pseudonocardiaceae bacterium]
MAELIDDVLARLDVRRRGEAVLSHPAQQFDLPYELPAAAEVISELTTALDQICAARDFPKGCGLAAPQLGVARAAAVVRIAGAADLALINPEIVSTSGGDVRWEGCLSFFDVRGRTLRPVELTLQWTAPDGETTSRTFNGATARMIGHECDHLDGILYADRLALGTTLVGLNEYQEGGRAWQY